MNQANKDGVLGNKHRMFMKKHELPDTFCFAPYVNIDLDQSGKILPCHKSVGYGKGDWKTKDIIDQYNNEYSDLRKTLFSGNKHYNCSLCYTSEISGLPSTRYDYTENVRTSGIDVDSLVSEIKQNQHYINPKHIQSIEIRVSSTCNLECMHCGVHSSSKWMSRVNSDKKFKDYISYNIGVTNIDQKKYVFENPKNMKSFFDEATNLRNVQFSGGEPLMNKNHIEWLSMIQNKKNIELRYHSNLQHKLYEDYLPYWKDFKNIILTNSWDTGRRLYPYFRYGGDYDNLSHNLSFIKNNTTNTRIVGTITVNLFSLFDFEDYLKLWKEYNIIPHISFVENTHPLSLCWLPDKLKKSLISEAREKTNSLEKSFIKKRVLELIDEIENFAFHKTQNDLPNKTKDYINNLDRVRNTDIRKVCPELNQYF